MKLSRRGLLGWLGALTGAAAVSRVAPVEAETAAMSAGRRAALLDAERVERGEKPLGPYQLHPEYRGILRNWVPPSKRFAHHFNKPVRLSREHGFTEPHDATAYSLNTVMRGHAVEGDACTRCFKHTAWCKHNPCDPLYPVYRVLARNEDEA